MRVLMVLTAVLMLGVVRVVPAAAQIEFGISPEIAQAVEELSIVRLFMILVLPIFMVGMGFLGRSILRMQTIIERERDANHKADADEQARAEAAAKADREERGRYLELLWAMQNTQVQMQASITAVNDSMRKQVLLQDGQVTTLTAHNAEAKERHDRLTAELTQVRIAVKNGYTDMAQVVQKGIHDGMEAAATVFADRLDTVIKPLTGAVEGLRELAEKQAREAQNVPTTDDPSAAAGAADAGGGASALTPGTLTPDPSPSGRGESSGGDGGAAGG